MNPINKIKKGIEKQDWDLVCEGYNSMTGQALSSPNGKSNFFLEPPWNPSMIQQFKKCLVLLVDNIDRTSQEDGQSESESIVDAPPTEIEQEVIEDDMAQPTDDDDEKNVDFNEVTSAGDGVGLYGNKTVLITEKPTANQIKLNKKRAAAREKPKVYRSPPKTYEVQCTECENTFDSPIRTGEFGQKCPKCLKSTNRER